MTFFHTNTPANPETIPATAPAKFVRFQKSEKQHERAESCAKTGPGVGDDAEDGGIGIGRQEGSMMATTMIVARDTQSTCLSVASFFRTPLKKFCEMAEEVIKSCESEVLIVAARMPERITPTRTTRMPEYWPRSCAMMMKMDSALAVMPWLRLRQGDAELRRHR